MKQYKKIAIVGVGLIGGSLALAIKKRKLADRIIGFVKSDKSFKYVKSNNIVDEVHYIDKYSVSELKGCDLIILATPVSIIIENMKLIAKHVDAGAKIIDVGSTKSKIVQVGKKLFGNAFVGCHPMAGKEKSGPEFSDPDLFEKAACFVTSEDAEIDEFWKSLGSTVGRFTPVEHDLWVAKASHVPHILAFALFQSFPYTTHFVTNPSIRDFARLSQSDPILWADILSSNSKNILIQLHLLKDSIIEWENALKKQNIIKIIELIKDANKKSVKVLWKDEHKQ